MTCMVLWHTPYVCMPIWVSKKAWGPANQDSLQKCVKGQLKYPVTRFFLCIFQNFLCIFLDSWETLKKLPRELRFFLVALNTIGHHIRYLRKQNYNMRGDLHTLMYHFLRFCYFLTFNSLYHLLLCNVYYYVTCINLYRLIKVKCIREDFKKINTLF